MPADQERIGKKLVDALKNSTGSGRREVEVDHDGTTARARIEGSGPYGSAIDELTVVRPGEGDGDLERQADDLVDRLSYMPERVRKHEIAPALGGGILRSEPDEMRNREYQEIGLQGGHEARVRRYRYDPEAGERRAIPQNYAHDTLERLTDDLADVLGPADDESPEP